MKETGDGRRVARVEREVQQTVAQFLISGFRFPLPGLVTVSRVVMPGDLRTAKVYISVLGEPEAMNKAVQLLQERSFEVQNFIASQLKMRFCPKLTFYADHNTEQILKVEKILQTLEEERQSANKQASGSATESSLESHGDLASSREDENS